MEKLKLMVDIAKILVVCCVIYSGGSLITAIAGVIL